MRAGAEARGNNLHAPHPLYNVLRLQRTSQLGKSPHTYYCSLFIPLLHTHRSNIIISNCHHLRDASKMKPNISGLKSHLTSVNTFYLLLILDRKDGKLYLELEFNVLIKKN